MVPSPNCDTDFFDIVAQGLQVYILAPYLVIIYQVYILQASIDLTLENGLTLKKARSRKYPSETIKRADYAVKWFYVLPSLALLATPTQANFAT